MPENKNNNFRFAIRNMYREYIPKIFAFPKTEKPDFSLSSSGRRPKQGDEMKVAFTNSSVERILRRVQTAKNVVLVLAVPLKQHSIAVLEGLL